MQATPLAAPNARPATALLLAAGRGERMRPLTDSTPKPLLRVQGKPLMQWPMEALGQGGVSSLVINTDWLGTQISDFFGANFQASTAAAPMQLHYSQEGRDFGGALETAGGIVRALPQLDEAFWVAAGDVFAPDFVFSAEVYAAFKARDALAHLWLVPNPAHVPKGDFALGPDGRIQPRDTAPADWPRHTYSTIGLYRPEMVEIGRAHV